MTEFTRNNRKLASRRWLAEAFSGLWSPFTVFVWAAFIVLATVAGPFGTFEAMTPGVRFLFWSAVVSSGVVVGYAVRALTMVFVRPEQSPQFDVLAVLLMTVIFTPILIVVSAVATRLSGVHAPPYPLMALYVFVTSAVVFGLRRFAPGFEPRGAAADAPETPRQAPEPRLLRRVPVELRGDVIRLSAQGHFVEVVTSVGTQTLRMRISDAIDEMEPVEGYCVHRSHWVTKAVIVASERENAHKCFVILSNGDRIPVSRRYRPGLVEAGIIQS